VCDFNGDGFLDIAVGASDSEDRERAPRTDQQGSIQVFVSYDGTFLTIPDQVIYGEIPGPSGYTAHLNMRVGERMAAGDFDGDGLCDLAVNVRRPDPDVSDDGGFLVYRGRAPMEPSRGGLEPRPSFGAVATSDPEDRTSNFAYQLAMGDLDGDGMAEVVASQDRHDVADIGDAGALRVFRGRPLTGEATSLSSDRDADLSIEGGDGQRNVGNTVVVVDYDGDGNLDLLSGDSRGEEMDAEDRRPGMVRVYPGRDGSLPAPTPSLTFRGPVSEGHFGEGFGVVGARIVAYAPYVDDVGALYLATAPTSTSELELPRATTGRQLGASVAFVGDVNGDGRNDVAIGAPNERVSPGGTDYGVVHVHYGDGSGGVSMMPNASLSGFSEHSSSDWVGYDVAPAGDFDGDGYDDIAVLARYEDQPDTFDPAELASDGSCPAGRRNNSGAVWIFGGGPSGVSTRPGFVFYGPYADRNVERVAGGFDFDGDGYDDILVGSVNWDGGGSRRGGFAVFRGRAADPMGLTTASCDTVFVMDGEDASDELGASLSPLGDLDGDGCDEIGAGAARLDSSDEREDRDEGALYVIFGYGGVGCPATTPELLRLDSNRSDSRAGQALAGGADVDGDGVPDVVVGAGSYRDGRGEVGRIYFVSGEYVLRSRGTTGFVPMLDPTSSAQLTHDGSAAGERLGSSVALVAGAGPSGLPAIAAGSPEGDSAGPANTGGAVVLRYGAAGFEATPITTLVGETFQVDGMLGASMSGSRDGNPELIVGAPWSGALSQEQGAAYLLDLSP
jgi:hypothetical protein